MRISIVLFAALLAACSHGNDPTPPAATTKVVPQREPVKPTRDGHFSPAITAEDFAAFDQRVSSDEFEGRAPATMGERMVTTYLIDQFQRMGLKPGNKDSYLQAVPTVETTVLADAGVDIAVSTGGNVDKYTYRDDAIVRTLQGKANIDLADSDIVFAGYGVVAPEYQWNDFAGIDVKGKTVIVLVNDPGWGNGDATLFKGKAMTYYGRWMYKYEECARQGAAACLIVHDTAGAGYPWQVVVNSWSSPQFDLPQSEDPSPRVMVAGWITTDAAKRLFAKAGADFDALKKSADNRGFKSSPLNAKFSTKFTNQIRNVQTTNVLALLPGSQRPNEVIVYSAHWDHFGRDPKLQGDQIYNGAIDNGTGLAGLLEIADAFAHQQPPPQRSILFMAPTLEEAGLLGSKYYTLHPTFPMNKTVADINMDELIPWGKTKDMAVMGFGQSQMDGYLKDALATQNRVVSPDEEPENGFFYRSDQLNFARMGVPVLFARGGFTKVDGGEPAGRAAYDDFTKNRYHKPADNYDPNWDLSGVIEDVLALYAVGKRLADETTWPQWAADSEFKATREASLKSAAH
ncbi:MAG TPA: M28 family metallopeptidase [Rudaea sp.]|jgi:Zn-dependent M28 family amino/carboxypeptidase|nr:M28 family metallopeptidase [Rudaea sp.]